MRLRRKVESSAKGLADNHNEYVGDKTVPLEARLTYTPKSMRGSCTYERKKKKCNQ